MYSQLRKPNIRQKIRILNSLIVPNNLKWGTVRDFSTSVLLQNMKKK